MMTGDDIENKTAEAALDLADSHDEDALYALIGMREQRIEQAPTEAANPRLAATYDESVMGPLDDVKAIGRRIAVRWSRSLFEVVCGDGDSGDTEARKKLLDALNVNEAATVGVVTTLLLTLPFATPAIAAPVAVIIVRKFLQPAMDELCEFWEEQLDA